MNNYRCNCIAFTGCNADEKKRERNLVYLMKQVRQSFMKEVLFAQSVKRIVHACQESRGDKSIQGKRVEGMGEKRILDREET